MLRRVRATFASPASNAAETTATPTAIPTSSSKRVKRDGPDECSDEDELDGNAGRTRAYFTTGKGALASFLRRIAGLAAVGEVVDRDRSPVVPVESTYCEAEDALVKEYVADAFEPSQPYLEIATQYGDDNDGARRETNETASPSSGSYGLRLVRDVSANTVVMELNGARQLITSSRCARTRELGNLVDKWIDAQRFLQTVVHREVLRQRRRAGTLARDAPWAEEDDLCGDGFVVDPTAKRVTLTLDETALCCVLVLEKRKGSRSTWYDYLSKLPSLEEFRRTVPVMHEMPDFIDFWGFDECNHAHTHQPRSNADIRWMIKELYRAQRAVEVTYKLVVAETDFSAADACGTPFTYDLTRMTKEEFFWAYACMTTRSFQSPNAPSNDPVRDMLTRKDFTGVFMAPVLDFANHKRPREVKYETTDGLGGDGKVTVTTLRDFSAGEFMHIAYGAKANTDLFFRYGFCVEDNVEPDGSSNDVFRVDRDDFKRVLRNNPEDRIFRNHDSLLRFASSPEYTYAPFEEILNVARTHFLESEPELLAVEQEVDEMPTRDDDVWNRDEDVFAPNDADDDDDDDDEANALMWGLDGEEDDGEDGDGGDDDAENPDATYAERLALDETFAAEERARVRVEVKSLRAVADYISSLHRDPPEPSLDDRLRLYDAIDLWFRSRARTLDAYALAALYAAESLLEDEPAAVVDDALRPPRGSTPASVHNDAQIVRDAARRLADARIHVFRLARRRHPDRA